MKMMLFLLVVLLGVGKPQLSNGQPASGGKPTFNHAAICVQDLKRSITFYNKVLTLEETPNPFNDGAHAWFKIGPGLQLHVIQHGCTLTANKDVHLCFSVPSVTEFISHLEKLGVTYTNLKGVGKEPTVRVDGVKQIYLQEPDGYWVEINDAK